MPAQNPAIDMASIEAISVVFAAFMVWLSALVQNVSNVSERGSKYVMSDLFHLRCRVSLVVLHERSPTISSLP
jgi:hypothetical protein